MREVFERIIHAQHTFSGYNYIPNQTLLKQTYIETNEEQARQINKNTK